jgi:hypothetical protein
MFTRNFHHIARRNFALKGSDRLLAASGIPSFVCPEVNISDLNTMEDFGALVSESIGNSKTEVICLLG